eukprot:15646-Prymnesium_polylepis.1
MAATTLAMGVLNESRRLPFTACDRDHLPVDHQDDFSASLAASARDPEFLRVDYVGTGTYEILLAVSTHGAFSVLLQLDGKRTVERTGLAVCPGDRVPLGEGQCGCKPGSEPEPSGMRCRMCAAGQSKVSAGDTQCTLCVAGKHQPSVGRTSCHDCAVGTYQPEQGSLTCAASPKGTAVPFSGSGRPTECNPGACAVDLEAASYCSEPLLAPRVPLCTKQHPSPLLLPFANAFVEASDF